MSRTVAPSPTDHAMWRRLLARTHPDAGGDEALFVWTTALREHVAGDSIEPPAHTHPRRTSAADTDRVPFEGGLSCPFAELTHRALTLAESVGKPYASLLWLLTDCGPAYGGALVREERRGASYRRLAAIGHRVGMSKAQRVKWYRLAESIPLADRHAGHILGKLNRAAA
jgi:hypothetical protein